MNARTIKKIAPKNFCRANDYLNLKKNNTKVRRHTTWYITLRSMLIYWIKIVINSNVRKEKKSIPHFRLQRTLFDVIDDKHIVINNESPFKVAYNLSTTISPHSNFCHSYQRYSHHWALCSKNFIELKWKSICFATEISTDLFLLNVNIPFDVQSSLMNHYCCSYSSLSHTRVCLSPTFFFSSHRHAITFDVYYVSVSIVIRTMMACQISVHPLVIASLLICRISRPNFDAAYRKLNNRVSIH